MESSYENVTEPFVVSLDDGRQLVRRSTYYLLVPEEASGLGEVAMFVPDRRKRPKKTDYGAKVVVGHLVTKEYSFCPASAEVSFPKSGLSKAMRYALEMEPDPPTVIIEYNAEQTVPQKPDKNT